MSKPLLVKSSLALGAALILPCAHLFALDNGTQTSSKFRINYAGYLPQANKLALYIASNTGAKVGLLAAPIVRALLAPMSLMIKAPAIVFIKLIFPPASKPALI